MNRKEIRERSEELESYLSCKDPRRPLSDLDAIESFGIEIAKSVAEDCARLAGKTYISDGKAWPIHEPCPLCRDIIGNEIREYAKRLEGDEK